MTQRGSSDWSCWAEARCEECGGAAWGVRYRQGSRGHEDVIAQAVPCGECGGTGYGRCDGCGGSPARIVPQGAAGVGTYQLCCDCWRRDSESGDDL